MRAFLHRKVANGTSGPESTELLVIIVSDDEDIDALLTPYEMDKLTRRQLLPALAIMVASVNAVAQQEQISGLVKPRTLDHVNVQVVDLARAERLYRALFGVAALRPLPVGPGAPPAFGFGLPSGSFLSFQKNEKPGARLYRSLLHRC